MAHHKGFLTIEVLDITDTDVVVLFKREKGWKPT
jgi:hypothetical protein